MNNLALTLGVLETLAAAAPVALDASDVLTRLERESGKEIRLSRVFDKLIELQEEGAVVRDEQPGPRRLYRLPPEIEKRESLWRHARSFIADQRISCPETVYQTDRVIENAYEFIGGVCDIVGYHKDEDE